MFKTKLIKDEKTIIAIITNGTYNYCLHIWNSDIPMNEVDDYILTGLEKAFSMHLSKKMKIKIYEKIMTVAIMYPDDKFYDVFAIEAFSHDSILGDIDEILKQLDEADIFY